MGITYLVCEISRVIQVMFDLDVFICSVKIDFHFLVLGAYLPNCVSI